MTSKIEAVAELSVGRGCAFAGLAIGTFVVGMIGEPHKALQLGGVLSLLACFVLLLKANLAMRVSYKRTEAWLLLDRAERPSPAVAQRIMGTTLRTVYLRFALYAAVLALAMLSASVLFGLLPRAVN